MSRKSVLVVEYDPRWPSMFEEERRRILDAARPWLVSVEHVGSTSVVGLAAKPLIDMMGVVRELRDAEHVVAPLARLGYEYVPEFEEFIPDRRYFRRGGRDASTHHLHVVERGGERWAQYLLFRDYLRAHPEAARDYAKLKMELAELHRDERAAYTEAKTTFVQDIIERARAGRRAIDKEASDEQGG